MGVADCFLFCASIAAYSIYYIYTNDLQLHDITINNIVSSRVVGTGIIFTYRSLFALVVLVTNSYVLFDSAGLTMTLSTRTGSSVSVHIKHLERFTTFTVWSWTLIGVYFGIVSLCSIITVYLPGWTVPQLLLQFAWILFEVQFSISILITVVVTFVLIPGGKSRGLPVNNFFKITPLLMHNANVIFMLVESILNDIPFQMNHIPFALLYGLTYVAFSWAWFQYKGVFYYFFLDYGRPWAVLMYMGVVLAVSLSLFYVLVGLKLCLALCVLLGGSINVSTRRDPQSFCICGN